MKTGLHVSKNSRFPIPSDELLIGEKNLRAEH